MAHPTGSMDVKFSFNEKQLANITQRLDDFAGHIELFLDHLKVLNSRLVVLEERLAAETP